MWGEDRIAAADFATALTNLGNRGEGRARDAGLFNLTKTLLLRHCVPFGPAKLDTGDPGWALAPRTSQRRFSGETCLHLSEQSRIVRCLEQTEKNTDVEFLRGGKRKEERIFAEFFRN